MSHRIPDRGRRDAAGVGPYKRDGVRLVRMKDLDGWHVADGEPDIRGWEVRTLSGREVGKVSDLLIDAELGEAVMLDVDLANSDRHTLAPLRAAQIDRADRVVRIDTADLEGELPSLARGAASTDDVRSFGDRYDKAYGDRGLRSDREYLLDRGDDRDLKFSRRDAELDAPAGDREVPLDRSGNDQPARLLDSKEIEKRDVRYASDGAEETVIERRPVVIEEVVVRRRVVQPDSESRPDSGQKL